MCSVCFLFVIKCAKLFQIIKITGLKNILIFVLHQNHSIVSNYKMYKTGIENVDYSLYPSKQQMMNWLRNYIEENNNFHQIKFTDEEIQSQTSQLYEQVNQFSMVSMIICLKCLFYFSVIKCLYSL